MRSGWVGAAEEVWRGEGTTHRGEPDFHRALSLKVPGGTLQRMTERGTGSAADRRGQHRAPVLPLSKGAVVLSKDCRRSGSISTGHRAMAAFPTNRVPADVKP